jgi:hypothetical protein
MKKEKFLFIYEKLKIEDYNEENSKTVYNKTEFIKFVKNGSIKVLDNNFKLEDFIKRSKNYL